MNRLRKIIKLHDRPDLIAEASHLMGTIWPEYYGPSGPGDATVDMTERCREHGLPLAMLALDDAGQILGSGTLAGPSYGSAEAEPLWIMGLCVPPGFRAQGIASVIVEALEDQARKSGEPFVYATTQTATGLLQRRGWQRLRHFDDDQGRWQVLRQLI